MQDELLHAPVQQFANVDFVFRWARNFVNPAKFLELFPGLAEHAEDFSVQADLVHAARKSIRSVEHLVRRGRNAHRPGRTGPHRAYQISTRLVADSRGGIRIVKRFADLDLAEVFSVAVEHFDARIAAIGDVDVSLRVRGDAMRRIELSRLVAGLAE